jgi:predicted nucleic acid-binding protein
VSGLIADTSVAIKWFAREEQSDVAEAILEAGVDIHAPDFMWIETANGLWKKWRQNVLPREDVGVSVAKLRDMIDYWHADWELIENASALSMDLAHPVYDCIFLVLARKLNIPLVTADKRLLGIAPDGLAVALGDWRL